MLKRCISFIVVALFAVCMHTVVAQPHANFGSDINDLNTIASISTEVYETSTVTPDSNNGSAFNDDIATQYCTTPRRVFADYQNTERSFAPNYHLLVAFLAPPLLEMATRTRTLVPSQQHWTAHIATSSSRISGWKESNALYSQKLPLFA
ncbi:hypothetical protein [Vibrio agarivorans]|uniref:hypothetical protein n=1 Tax=Vibrio agarivorans TaxID=153622 RepID=UPI00222E6854|nr:hypothetical protein [Vibrio agarivorans]